MDIKTSEDVDRVVDALSSWIVSDSTLMDRLRACRDHATRWMTLELKIFESIADKKIPIEGFDLAVWENGTYRMRESVFYKLQTGNYGLEFGFCHFFVPAWRNLAEYFLSGSKTDPEKNWAKYRYGNRTYATTCNGTDTYKCKFLGRPPEPNKDMEYQQLFARLQVARKRINKNAMN